uniref:Uncharacterized protein n=1 Tax=Meloidogyne floridensis TaxID=298350 RepID=A0A915NE64_9BILA
MRQQQAQLFSLMRKIFMELAQTEPAVKEIFCKADYVDCWEKASGGGPNPASMEEHIRMLIKFIDDLVQFVEGDSDTQQIINSSSKCIGQQHAFLSRTSQLSANVWDKLGEIVMEKVCSVERPSTEAAQTPVECQCEELAQKLQRLRATEEYLDELVYGRE